MPVDPQCVKSEFRERKTKRLGEIVFHRCTVERAAGKTVREEPQLHCGTRGGCYVENSPLLICQQSHVAHMIEGEREAQKWHFEGSLVQAKKARERKYFV